MSPQVGEVKASVKRWQVDIIIKLLKGEQRYDNYYYYYYNSTLKVNEMCLFTMHSYFLLHHCTVSLMSTSNLDWHISFWLIMSPKLFTLSSISSFFFFKTSRWTEVKGKGKICISKTASHLTGFEYLRRPSVSQKADRRSTEISNVAANGTALIHRGISPWKWETPVINPALSLDSEMNLHDIYSGESRSTD